MTTRLPHVVGMVSVGWWHYTNDLRPYAWVQFAPLLALAFTVVAVPASMRPLRTPAAKRAA